MTDASSGAANPAEQEFEATRAVYTALQPLDDEARERVVLHVAGMLDINAAELKVTSNATTDPQPGQQLNTTSAATNSTPQFDTFAELFNAADPQSAADKALVAGYWLQVCRNADSFDGQSANKELNHLGHKLSNVTMALGALNSQRPALAIQLAKSGSSRQARKTYKVTVAGVDAVRAMLNG